MNPSDATELFAVPFVKGVILSPDRTRFLLQRRLKEGDPYHGFWELPGGKMRLGETTAAALEREAEEEAGVHLREVLGQTGDEITDRFDRRARVVVPLVTVEIASGPWPFLGHYFVCLADGEPRRTDEGGHHRWVTVEEFRVEFLGPEPAEECTTLDLLAMRIALSDGRLEAFLRAPS